jgi:hypothetical protein
MADTLENRRAGSASAARGRGRGAGPGSITLNLNQPAAFSAGAVAAQQPGQAGAGRGGGGAPIMNQSQPGLVGQPFLNTSAMMGINAPTMVAARPTQEQQQHQNAMRVQAQLEAFGISALVTPDHEESTEEHLRAHGFANDEGLSGNLPAIVPKRGLLRCSVFRERTGIINTNQKFSLFIEAGERFVLCCRKRANKQTSNYLLSRHPDDLERGSIHFHGKVRANFTGTDFVIYDDGIGPKDANVNGARMLRKELGAVVYETNIAGTRGPRKMTVVLPQRREDGTLDEWQPAKDEDSIVAAYKANPQSERFVVLVNKEPTWNEQLRSYQLNFHGRVSKPSVKNFQLVDRRNPNRVVLQFGKRDDDRFSLDFQAPLNATQALSIAITAFDNKIACE